VDLGRQSFPGDAGAGVRLALGTEDCTELALPGGPVGVFVGGRSQKLLGPGIAEWLGRHE
jgi:hypothetical protein